MYQISRTHLIGYLVEDGITSSVHAKHTFSCTSTMLRLCSLFDFHFKVYSLFASFLSLPHYIFSIFSLFLYLVDTYIFIFSTFLCFFCFFFGLQVYRGSWIMCMVEWHCTTYCCWLPGTTYISACVVVLWPQSLYLSRMKNQRVHWVCRMSTST